MSDIKNRLTAVKDQIITASQRCGRNPETITLVAVSKKKSADAVIEAIDSGVDTLGENYIQEAVEKIEEIKKKYSNNTVSWHFIGHLQSNKAKVAVKYFDYIQTVDSFKLAQEISRQAEKIGKIQNILIQINISSEQTKSGADEEDAINLAESISHLEFVSIRGLMGMPPFFDDPELARPYFRQLAKIKELICNKNIPNVYMEHLSMGMSGDFKVAIEEGATIVRIGTSIFGSR